MSHLPENIDDWPDDPLAILDLESAEDPKAVKRSYKKLLKIFRQSRLRLRCLGLSVDGGSYSYI